jgi:hypothetical protein
MAQQPDLRDKSGSRGNAPAIIAGVAAVLAAAAAPIVTKVIGDQPTAPPMTTTSGATTTRAAGSFSGEKDFEHLRVQVTAVRDVPSGSDLSHQHDLYVRVCITSPMADAVKGRTRISWDPWQLNLVDGRAIKPDRDLPLAKGMLNPAKYYDTGSCPSGYIPFTVDGTDSPVSTVDYVNRQGNAATFSRH